MCEKDYNRMLEEKSIGYSMKSAIISTSYAMFDISGPVVQNNTQFQSFRTACPVQAEQKEGRWKSSINCGWKKMAA
jgi:hypothetical protein